jgi:CRP-like cAMP-binding protein
MAMIQVISNISFQGRVLPQKIPENYGRKIVKNCSDCFLNKSDSRILASTKEALLREKSVRIFKTGSCILSQGSVSANVYCLSQGKIGAFELKRNGDSTLIFTMHRRGVFPLISVLSQEPAKFEYKTMEQSKLCEYPIKTIQKLISGDPAFENMLLRTTCALRDDIFNRMRTLLATNATDKVLMTLNHFKDKKGLCRVSRKEISLWTGLTIETVIRTLSSLEKKAKIKKGSGEIQIYESSKEEESVAGN